MLTDSVKTELVAVDRCAHSCMIRELPRELPSWYFRTSEHISQLDTASMQIGNFVTRGGSELLE